MTTEEAKDYSEVLDVIMENMVTIRSVTTVDHIFTLATDMETIAVQLQAVLEHIAAKETPCT